MWETVYRFFSSAAETDIERAALRLSGLGDWNFTEWGKGRDLGSQNNLAGV